MSKFCVFCGNPPTDKNMEHVVPQWLIKMTGDEKRLCNLKTILPRDIPFIQFKFPACEACNSKYSDMEGSVKNIIVKILDGQSVNASEINLLMDWMDKVRIGLWLGALYLKKQVDQISPHMHIESRMGLKDRILIIERQNHRDKRLSFAGPAQQTFLHNPCAFQMIINNYIFTNVSEYGLVSRRLGFPYCDRVKFLDIDNAQFNTYKRAPGRVINPVVRGLNGAPDKTIIYQSCSPAQAAMFPDLYKSDYVTAHSLDAATGLGGIFYQKNANGALYLPPTARVNLTPKFTTKTNGQIVSQVFELQNYVIDNTYTLKFASPDVAAAQQKMNQQLMALNNMYIRACQTKK